MPAAGDACRCTVTGSVTSHHALLALARVNIKPVFLSRSSKESVLSRLLEGGVICDGGVISDGGVICDGGVGR